MVRKRSVKVNGHATSVSLEDEFWGELKRIADGLGIALSELVERIDDARAGDNLSSALRLAVLDDLKRNRRD
jgi:predicted DNA-binding ribbon-helix-helix protein